MSEGTTTMTRIRSMQNKKTRRRRMLWMGTGTGIIVIFAGFLTLLPTKMTASTGVKQAVTDRSPVNLATPVNFRAGLAHRSATIVEGDARIEVLAPGLLRLEYAPSGRFENRPTVNVVNRRFPAPRYTASVHAGWLTIRTSQLTFRYKVGSGPFTPENTALSYLLGNRSVIVHPTWGGESTFGESSQAGAANLAGGAVLATDHTGYQSTAGFITGLGGAHGGNGASATWNVLGAPAGPARVTIRYANNTGLLGGPASRTIDLSVNGRLVRTLTLAPTASWHTWASVTTRVLLRKGTNAVALVAGPGTSGNVNVDTLAVGPPTGPVPILPRTGRLGGWIRSFDSYTYGEQYTYSSSNSVSAQQAQAILPPLHRDGLLNRAGWRLLDDTHSAVWTHSGWVRPRSPHGDVEDGYLFAYGRQYKSALRELAQLTGPAPLLARYIFGVWFSRYYPYTAADYEQHLLPDFRAHRVPLDTLSVDTDWKAPNTWNGWEWNPALFPHPQSFLDWAKANGIHVTLNIHSSIAKNDPRLAEVRRIAGNTLASSSGFSGASYVWDWSKIPQAESNFTLQQQYEHQGIAFWWLDWCCDNSSVSMPGLTPDNWIDHLYAQEMVNRGERGFVLARIGASLQHPNQVYPAGPWSAHTAAIHFTGDTWGTWNTLAYETTLAPAEASIGEPYVSNDIGSFLGTPPGGPMDSPDLYDRWVQFGVFQPVLRLHSNHGDRLPWEYPQPVQGITEHFLRLREALVPYTYTLAAQAHFSGLPITRALYLDYPDLAAAYEHPHEYLYGPNFLVAPVITPGKVVKRTMWFPPGRWIDYFTGATISGPATVTLAEPLDRMPVFVKAGAIVPEQLYMNHVGAKPVNPLILRVFSGGDGRFYLYSDAGAGLGYQKGQFTETPIVYSEGGRTTAPHSTLTIGSVHGRFPGEMTHRQYRIELTDISAPHRVFVDQQPLANTAVGSDHSGWWYDSSTATLMVNTPSLPTGERVTVSQIGGRSVTRGEPAQPAVVAFSLSPSRNVALTAGHSVAVTAVVHNQGPGSIIQVRVHLKVPQGWMVSPAAFTAVSDVRAGQTTAVHWLVTAPKGENGRNFIADLTANLSYVSRTTGTTGREAVTQKRTPVITSVQPARVKADAVVTVTGVNFGAGQSASNLVFLDNGISWGAPNDITPFHIDSWSSTKIVFTVPTPQGTPYHVVPGTTASIAVTTQEGTSNTVHVKISG